MKHKKYTEYDISKFLWDAISSNTPISSFFAASDEKKFPLSAVYAFLYTKREPYTDCLKKAIIAYKDSGINYKFRKRKISDSEIMEIVSLRKEGLSIKEISKKTLISPRFCEQIVSGKSGHPKAPTQRIGGGAKRGRKPLQSTKK